jgi:phosphatidylserine decarboxylase
MFSASGFFVLNYKRFMVKEGYPFTIIPILLALIFVFFQIWIVVAILVLLAVFMAYFFRDPARNVPTEPDIIVSAADGRVTRVENRDEGKFVSVFLSPLDVHINRSPIEGKISKVDYVFGKKIPATSDIASIVNERNSLTIVGEKATVVVTQIAGIVARRIVCWRKQDETMQRGEKFGLIKFSSRTDLLMPHNVEVLVKVDDRVVGGETIIARIKNA